MYFSILREYVNNQQIVKRVNVSALSTKNTYFGTFILKMTSDKSEINF